MRIRTVGKLAAYAKAPKSTYALLHPIKGARRAIFLRGLKTLVTKRNGARLGAAVALPLAVAAIRGMVRR
jgi:hypothetical protein